MLGTSFTTNVRLGRAALVAWALSLALSLLGGSGATALAASGSATAAPPCTLTLTGRVPGSVTVSSGEVLCLNAGASVDGGIIVKPGGTLVVNGARVGGAVLSDGARSVTICGSTIGGSVSIKNTTGTVQLGDNVNGCTPNRLTGAVLVSPTPTTCNARANNTPEKLIPCIRPADLWAHMQNFQAIADANPGPDGMPSRNSGEPGYKASADYVANLMRAAGYNVTIQTYPFDYFAFVGVPQFGEVSPTAQDYALVSEWNPGRSTGSANSAVQPAGGVIIPPAPTTTSTSGCTPADFTGFVAGRIALVQRGGCNFGVKVLNAQAAGASGVIVFNEGNPGRTDVISGSLLDAAGNPFIPTVPVAFTSFAIGSNFYDQYQQAVQTGGAPPVAKLDIHAIEKPNAPDYNVIAESKGGDPNSTVVVDAHLDAIFGAGMLDNASGSTTILDIAQMMKRVTPLHKLRFIWFGGEELGLLGSSYYVNNLSPAELGKISYDLDADVTATPNYIIGVLDPAGPDLFGRTVTTTFPANVYGPSQISRDQSIQYFNSIGLNHELFSPVGTDAFSFNEAGIPASGLLTGQDCCKDQAEVDLFGGSLGNFEGLIPSFDGGCVDNPFRWCDNLSNNDPAVLTFMSQAFANTVVRTAFDSNLTGATDQAVRHASARPPGAGASGHGRTVIR